MSFADVSCAKLSSKLQNLITKEGRLFLSLMIDCGSIKIMRTHYRFRPPDGGESPIHDVQDDEVQGCQMVCSQCTSKILYFYAKMVLKSLRIMQARITLNFTVESLCLFLDVITIAMVIMFIFSRCCPCLELPLHRPDLATRTPGLP